MLDALQIALCFPPSPAAVSESISPLVAALAPADAALRALLHVLRPDGDPVALLHGFTRTTGSLPRAVVLGSIEWRGGRLEGGYKEEEG